MRNETNTLLKVKIDSANVIASFLAKTKMRIKTLNTLSEFEETVSK